jgi:myo-inositol-1(or 4)-monophosphatase
LTSSFVADPKPFPPSGLEASAVTDRLHMACDLARTVGRAAREAWQEGSLAVDVKGPQDFVTAVDRDTERAIREAIGRTFPGDGVLGEEFGGTESDGPLWVVDPIDGTANFIRGLADWAVSLGLVHKGQLLAGIVYDGGRDRLYWAQKGEGAFCEGQRLACATTERLDQSLVMLGTNMRIDLDEHLGDHRVLRGLGTEYRRHGSAATGLLMVADGRVDAYYERHLNAWDALGGLCLAREAGAVCVMPPMESFLRLPGPVACAAPGISGALPWTQNA